MRERPIVISEPDALRLRGLLREGEVAVRDQEHLQELGSELERAIVLDAVQVPDTVVAMGSRVRLLDLTNGSLGEYSLVFPADADIAAHRISVLAPLGTALLGYKEGDEVEWLMPGGLRRLRIEAVSQPLRIDASERDLTRQREQQHLVA